MQAESGISAILDEVATHLLSDDLQEQVLAAEWLLGFSQESSNRFKIVAHAGVMDAIKESCVTGIPDVMLILASVVGVLVERSEYLLDKNLELAHQLFDLFKGLLLLEETADNFDMKVEVAHTMGQFAAYIHFSNKMVQRDMLESLRVGLNSTDTNLQTQMARVIRIVAIRSIHSESLLTDEMLKALFNCVGRANLGVQQEVVRAIHSLVCQGESARKLIRNNEGMLSALEGCLTSELLCEKTKQYAAEVLSYFKSSISKEVFERANRLSLLLSSGPSNNRAKRVQHGILALQTGFYLPGQRGQFFELPQSGSRKRKRAGLPVGVIAGK